jgi:hypothetical protein
MARLDRNPPVNFLGLFFMRWLMSATLVFGTYNPSGRSYLDWVAGSPDGLTPIQVFTGILILTLAVALLRMAYLSVGYAGLLTIVVLIMMAIVLAVGLRIVDMASITASPYMIEFWISLTLAVGASWAYVQRKLTGERDVLKSPP